MTFKFKQIRIYKRSLNQEPFSNTRKKQNCSKQSCKKRNREILRELTFANICAISFFSAQRCYTAKDIFCVSFRKNCAKVLWMETISLKSYSCPILYWIVFKVRIRTDQYFQTMSSVFSPEILSCDDPIWSGTPCMFPWRLSPYLI